MSGADDGSKVRVRDATEADIPAVQSIYVPHVLNGLASFEEAPPSAVEMKRRWRAVVDGGFPYLVAEHDSRIAGYAYASPYRARPGYRYSVENSVYVADEAHGLGVGSGLLKVLIERCTELGYRQMIAVIGDSENTASISLHAKHGFTEVGAIKSVGFKLGRWVDSVIMQLPLGEGDSTLPLA